MYFYDMFWENVRLNRKGNEERNATISGIDQLV